MKYSYTFKSEFFVVLSTEKGGAITRDTFSTRELAELFRDEVLMKNHDIEQIEILELLAQSY